MDDNSVQDLKQFIQSALASQSAQIDERLKMIDERFDKVEGKIDDLSSSVAEAIDKSNESTDATLNDHKQRITKLEQKAA